MAAEGGGDLVGEERRGINIDRWDLHLGLLGAVLKG